MMQSYFCLIVVEEFAEKILSYRLISFLLFLFKKCIFINFDDRSVEHLLTSKSRDKFTVEYVTNQNC